jgi:hypothetical protein
VTISLVFASRERQERSTKGDLAGDGGFEVKLSRLTAEVRQLGVLRLRGMVDEGGATDECW